METQKHFQWLVISGTPPPVQMYLLISALCFQLKINKNNYINILYYVLMNCCRNADPAANTINVGVPDTTIYLYNII